MKESDFIQLLIDSFTELKELIPLNIRSYYRWYSNSANHYFINEGGLQDQLVSKSPRTKHANIKKYGAGHCGEFSDALTFEIRKRLKAHKQFRFTEFTLYQMHADIDHSYIYINIILNKKEMYYALDLWKGDFAKLTFEEFDSFSDRKWGAHSDEKTWYNDDSLTSNSKKPRIFAKKVEKNHSKQKKIPKKNGIFNEERDIEGLIDYLKEYKQSLIENEKKGHSTPWPERFIYFDKQQEQETQHSPAENNA